MYKEIAVNNIMIHTLLERYCWMVSFFQVRWLPLTSVWALYQARTVPLKCAGRSRTPQPTTRYLATSTGFRSSTSPTAAHLWRTLQLMLKQMLQGEWDTSSETRPLCWEVVERALRTGWAPIPSGSALSISSSPCVPTPPPCWLRLHLHQTLWRLVWV